MQEMWLFGQLDTVRTSETVKDTEEQAKILAGLVERIVRGLGVKGEEQEEKEEDDDHDDDDDGGGAEVGVGVGSGVEA